MMLNMLTVTFVWVLLSVSSHVAAAAKKQSVKSRMVTLFNEAGVSIDVFWVNPDNQEIFRMSEEGEVVVHGDTMPLNTYAGHQFEIHQVPDADTGACGSDQTCRRVLFQVTDYDDQSKLQYCMSTLFNACTCLVLI
jgi:hypothetical protein